MKMQITLKMKATCNDNLENKDNLKNEDYLKMKMISKMKKNKTTSKKDNFHIDVMHSVSFASFAVLPSSVPVG